MSATAAPAKEIEPLQITVATAAKMLNRSPWHVRRLIRAGTLTGIYPKSNGPAVGKPVVLDPDEVKLYAKGRWDELRELQAAKQRQKNGRKGRKP